MCLKAVRCVTNDVDSDLRSVVSNIGFLRIICPNTSGKYGKHKDQLQLHLGDSNTDGSFTVVNSNSFLSP